MPILRAAAVHASPTFLSASATTTLTTTLIKRASINGASLIAFPESFIPGFPYWLALRSPAENHALFTRFAAANLVIDGPEIKSIRDVCRQQGVMVSLGFSEREKGSVATLFNSNVIIDEKGEIVVHHRKLVPTFFEKLVWAAGDGFGLRVAELGGEKLLDHGSGGTGTGGLGRDGEGRLESVKVGALICGENTNPLARYSLLAQGERVHVSSWPAIWPTRFPEVEAGGQQKVDETADEGTAKAKNYDNVSANRIRAAAHCFEAKAFGIVCASHLHAEAIETIVSGSHNPSLVRAALEKTSPAASMFLDPTGAVVPGFTIDEKTGEKTVREEIKGEEGILYADLDLDLGIEGKQYHDLAGGYQRFDVFDLKVDRTRRPAVTFTGDEPRR